jgi:signal peptide peptidase SppA
MDITDFSRGQCWGIIPEQFEILQRKFGELNITAPNMEKFFAKIPETRNDYTVLDGVAVIPITGAITKRSSLYSYFFNGSSLDNLAEVLRQALSDPAVRAIVLDIDSPGGTVNGVAAMAAEIFASRAEKPIVAFGNGFLASAAYWLGSAANAVIVDQTADVGSIGVLMIHYDYSEMDKRIGLKTTYLTAGKYKALGNDSEPLSQEAIEVFQKELDYIYGIFAADVAEHRDVSVEQVFADMADGRIFIGRQAVDAGLADMVGTIDTAIEMAVSLASERKTQIIKTGGMLPGKENVMFGKDKTVTPSTVEELVQLFPQLCETIRNQGAKSINVDEIAAQAVAGERARIGALCAVQFGEDAGAKFQTICASGITAEQLKAVKPPDPVIESEEDKKRAAMLAAINAAGPANPGAVNVIHVDFSKLPTEERAKAVWDSDPNIRDEFKMGGFKAYLAYCKNENNVRVFEKKAE